MNTIQTPGKFEGEPTYVEYFWSMDGSDYDFWSAEDRYYSVYNVTENDRAKYPDLEAIEYVVCWETDQGFVCHRAFENSIEFDKWRTRAEDFEG